MILSSTLDYYNSNADEFCNGTVNADMSDIYDKFEKYINPGCKIMDCGCGSGRDSKYFIEKGYEVTPIDGSEELCRYASNLLGKQVECMRFQDISCSEEFDAVWASASLLHVEKNELIDVIRKITKAIKINGIFYMSFKYGEYSGERNGRYFTDLNETSFSALISEIDELCELEHWITSDVRPGRSSEKWLNVILKKV